jgi:hypothetical protein
VSARGDALRAEAEWLETSHRNSAGRGYSEEYRAGYAAAAGWVRLHAQMRDQEDAKAEDAQPRWRRALFSPEGLTWLWLALAAAGFLSGDDARGLAALTISSVFFASWRLHARLEGP